MITKPAKCLRQRAAVFQPEFNEDLKYWVKTNRKVSPEHLTSFKRYCAIRSQGSESPNRSNSYRAAHGRDGLPKSIESSTWLATGGSTSSKRGITIDAPA